MVTPKEKAVELQQKYSYYCDSKLASIRNVLAKSLAIICINEVKREVTQDRKDYWNQVENELNLL